MRKTHKNNRRRQPQRHKAQGRKNRQLNNLAVIPVAVETNPQSSSGQSTPAAEIPVALKSSAGSANGSPVTTAEIPVAVAGGNGKAAKGKRLPRGAKAKVTAIPVAFKTRTRSARSRADRKRSRPQRVAPSQVSGNHNARLDAPVKPADTFTRAVVKATYVEEAAVDMAGRLGLASIGTFETISRLLWRMPAIAEAKTLGKVLRWKAVRGAPAAWTAKTSMPPPPLAA